MHSEHQHEMEASGQHHAPAILPLVKISWYPLVRILSLDVIVKRNPCPSWELNFGLPACSLVIILNELSQLLCGNMRINLCDNYPAFVVQCFTYHSECKNHVTNV
jgi:hypothetical protein